MNPMDIMAAGQGGQPMPPQQGGGLERLRAMLQQRVRSPQQIAEADMGQMAARDTYRGAVNAPMTTMDPYQLMMATYLQNMVPGQPQKGIGQALAAPVLERHRLDQARYNANTGLGAQEVAWANTDREEARRESDSALRDLALLERPGGLRGAGNRGVDMRTLPDGTIVVIDKNTGAEVRRITPDMSKQFKDQQQMYMKYAVEKGEYADIDEARAWATEMAMKDVGGATSRSLPQLPSMVGGQPSMTPSTRSSASLELAPGTDTAALIKQLEQNERLAVSNGDYERARELQDIRRMVREREGASGQTPAMGRRDVALQKGREKTAEKTAEMYAGDFEENVMKPARAFSNTGKIMQDFNTLGQMQHALKNGKFKEFMAGDTGRYALSLLPQNSDLRKGIANAQEAEKLTAGMVNQILLAAKGVQTEGDAQRARSQVTSVGVDEDANKYLEAYINETVRQLQMREQAGRAHKQQTGTFEGYDTAWQSSPIMKEARGSVKKLGNTWIGLTQYIGKFKEKYPDASDSDAIASWNRVKK